MKRAISYLIVALTATCTQSISAQSIDIEKYFPRYDEAPFTMHDFTQPFIQIPDTVAYRQLLQTQNPSDYGGTSTGFLGIARFDYNGETFAIFKRSFFGVRDEELYLFHISDKNGYPPLLRIGKWGLLEFCINDGIIGIFDLLRPSDVYSLKERRYRLDSNLTEIRPERPLYYDEAIKILGGENEINKRVMARILNESPLKAVKLDLKEFPLINTLPGNADALPTLNLSGTYNQDGLSETFAITEPKIVNLSNTIDFEFRPICKYRTGNDEYIIFYCISGEEIYVFLSLLDGDNLAESLLIYHRYASWLLTTFESKGNEIAIFSYLSYLKGWSGMLSAERYILDKGFRCVEILE